MPTFDYEVIQETNDTMQKIYFLVSVEYPMNLTLNIHREIYSSKLNHSIQIEIKKSNVDYKYRLRLTLANTNITYFLSKQDRLVKYFTTYVLANEYVKIVSIQKYKKSLDVTLGSEFEYSKKTYELIKTCSLIENKYIDDSSYAFEAFDVKLFKEFTYLDLDGCPTIFAYNGSFSNGPIKNTINLFIKLESNGANRLTTKLLICLLTFVWLVLSCFYHKP